MEQEKFPESVVIQCEKEQKAHELRRIVRVAQDAFSALRADVDFVWPQRLSDLTPQYCRDFYKPFRDSIASLVIDKDNPEEVLKKKKLAGKMERRQAETTILISKVRLALNDADLSMIYDQLAQTIVPTGDIEAIAEQRAQRDVPDMARDHWRMLQTLLAMYKEVREWEKKNGIRKQPLKTLFSVSQQRFCELWALGEMMLPTDESITAKYLRESAEKTFV